MTRNLSVFFNLSMISALVGQFFAFGGTAATSAALPQRPVAALVQQAANGSPKLSNRETRARIRAVREQLTQAQRSSLMLSYYSEIIHPLTDLEAFARLAELSSDLNTSASGFMSSMNGLVLDTSSNALAIAAGPAGRLFERIHLKIRWFPGYPSLLRFGCTGFAKQDGSNQVQHFWYSAAIAYFWSGRLADVLARYHEWNAPGLLDYLPGTAHGGGSPEDLELSRQGIQFGRALADGNLRIEDAGEWLRENLK